MKTLFYGIAVFCIFLVIGTAGAMETDLIHVNDGMIRSMVLIAIAVFFVWLAGRRRA